MDRLAMLKILINLVRRLPVMGLPSWSNSQTQPIAIQDVLHAVHLCLENPEVYTGSFDIGGPDRLTYRDLIEITAEEMRKKRWMFLPHFCRKFAGPPLRRRKGNSSILYKYSSS